MSSSSASQCPNHISIAEHKRRPSDGSPDSARGHRLRRFASGGKRWWRFHMRGFEDQDEQDWWFAGTAIPLLAATLGPLANVTSIAALVTYWRMDLTDPAGGPDRLPQLEGIPFEDPRWCYWLNVASLIMGFVGNFFLLMNFTGRIRYIISLPMTILLWYGATGILIAITISMELYEPPNRPTEQYTQGYWYAVISACFYCICSMLLMVNMLGYFLGHYPQRFNLTEHQRTLILQTMLFFIWLAGGAAVFARIEQDTGSGTWSFVNALYFCDVTILTVGFGDLVPTNDVGRGLVFPYSVGGIIMLGLMISSIHNFVQEMSQENVVQKHMLKQRARTMDRSVSTSLELKRRQMGAVASHDEAHDSASRPNDRFVNDHSRKPKNGNILARMPSLGPKKDKLLILRDERDRFNAMRNVQKSTSRFKRWWALSLSVFAFGILWAVGAIAFWQLEKDEQGMTYFRALYFCYVSLLTIGYGDLAPKSAAGRCFFLVWSLIAVPTMTILVSDMGDTVIGGFKNGTNRLADLTVLPKEGIWRAFLERHPWIWNWLQRQVAKRRVDAGFAVGPDAGRDIEDLEAEPPPTIERLAEEEDLSDQEMARRLAVAIRSVANDLKEDRPKKYSYEEWAEYTRLIRFTSKKRQREAGVAIRGEDDDDEDEEDEGLIEWDWIGEDSPLMCNTTEPEFVLDRLCESMGRYIRRLQGGAGSRLGSRDGPKDGRRSGSTDEDAIEEVGTREKMAEPILEMEREKERPKHEGHLGPSYG